MSYRIRSLFIALLLAFSLNNLASFSAYGQDRNAGGASKPKSEAKNGQEACDGALDIVPSKSATFLRKRRIGAKKSSTKSEAKTERNPIR
jgi:hypothetical protein